MTNLLDSDEEKMVVKEAIKQAATEWMDKQFAIVGKWTVGGLAVLVKESEWKNY